MPASDDALTGETWDNWGSLAWDLDRKRGFLLSTWTGLIDSIAHQAAQRPQSSARPPSGGTA